VPGHLMWRGGRRGYCLRRCVEAVVKRPEYFVVVEGAEQCLLLPLGVLPEEVRVVGGPWSVVELARTSWWGRSDR